MHIALIKKAKLFNYAIREPLLVDVQVTDKLVCNIYTLIISLPSWTAYAPGHLLQALLAARRGLS